MSEQAPTLFDLFPDDDNRSRSGGWIHELAAEPLTTLSQLIDASEVRCRLRSISWDFADAKTGYLTHDIHPYPAKYPPPVPANLVAQLSVPGDTVWDPFGGSGTTSLEAALLNRNPISTDANPLAALIGRAKTTTIPYETHLALTEWADELEYTAKSPKSCKGLINALGDDKEKYVPEIPNIEKWFHQSTVDELAYLRCTIDHLYDANQVAVPYVALSRTVQRVSFQESETRYVRKPRDVETGETLRVFARELRTCLNRSAAIASLLGFRDATFGVVNMARSMDDASSQFDQVDLSDNSVDAIVTSPPYPNATDYHLYHRFRMFWLGLDPRALGRIEIGSHLRHQRNKSGIEEYLGEMTVAIGTCYRILRPGRYAAFVLGDAIFQGTTYNTAAAIQDIASELGFEIIDTLRRNLPEHRRSFAKPARRARDERILILRKPDIPQTYTIEPPNYRLHTYERNLQLDECRALLGGGVRRISQDRVRVEGNFSMVSQLRRLTFGHTFHAPTFSGERTWQARLENGRSGTDARRKESNYVTHGLHPYKGKFYPQLVHSLLNIGQIEQGSRLLDPYCGSGTLLTEAALHGIHGHGIDMNPLAAKIARAKTQILSVDPAFVDRVLSQVLLKFAHRTQPTSAGWKWLAGYEDAAIRELSSWFPDTVLAKIGTILSEIRSVPDATVQEYLSVIVSSLLRDVSHQDPKDLRIRRRKAPLEDAPVFDSFRKNLEKQRNLLRRYYRIRHFSPDSLGTTEVCQGDATQWSDFDRSGIAANSVDAMITSPPYATALPYIDTYRLSLLVLNGATSQERRPLEHGITGSREIGTRERKELEQRIENNEWMSVSSPYAQRLIKQIYEKNKVASVGFRRKNQAALLLRYFDQVGVTLTNCKQALTTGAPAFVILGNNVTVAGTTEITIDSVRAVREIGAGIGWEDQGVIDITVTTDSHRHQKNAIKKNQILRFLT